VISIPSGAIKRGTESLAIIGEEIFQFLLVRLKEEGLMK